MAWLLNRLIIFMALGIWVKQGRAQAEVSVNERDNVEPFSLLCRIYNVAKNPPIKPVGTESYRKIVEEIDALSTVVREYKTINPKREAVLLAQTNLLGVTGKAKKIWDEVRSVDLDGKIAKAKDVFNKAIFGEGGKEGNLCHGALSEVVKNRIAACGSKNLVKKGDSAGKNLIVDIFCLCAKPTDPHDGVDNVCGVSVGTGDCTNKGPILHSAASMWNEVEKGCKNFGVQSTPSTENGNSLHREFLDRVMKGGNVKVKGSGNMLKPGLFGTAVSENSDSNFNCNGKTTVITTSKVGSGSCVFYGDQNWDENIEWLKKFKTGLQTTDELNNKTASWKQQLTTLLNRARELYKEVKEASQQEEKDMEEPKATPHLHIAENETADSATLSQRHILLMWALLLY